MVTHLHAYCLCCSTELGGNDAVELGRGGIPADMVMHRDNVRSSDYAKRYGVSPKTAQRDLTDMTDKNLIDTEGEKKFLRYIFDR